MDDADLPLFLLSDKMDFVIFGIPHIAMEALLIIGESPSNCIWIEFCIKLLAAQWRCGIPNSTSNPIVQLSSYRWEFYSYDRYLQKILMNDLRLFTPDANRNEFRIVSHCFAHIGASINVTRPASRNFRLGNNAKRWWQSDSAKILARNSIGIILHCRILQSGISEDLRSSHSKQYVGKFSFIE